MVAAHAAVGGVQHHVRGAVGAVAHPAAGGTGQYRGEAAPVEEHQALFAALKARLDGPQQVHRQAFAQRQLAGIHTAQRRQHGIGTGPLRQGEQPIAAAPGVLPAFQGRRGGAQQDGHAALAGAPDGHVAGRVAHPVLLLVGGVVFLVHQDQAQPRQRGEHRQAGADHHVATPAGPGQRRAPRRVVAPLCSTATRRRDTGAHLGFEAGGEGDLGYHSSTWRRAASASPMRPVDLGLAGAGHTCKRLTAKPGGTARSCNTADWAAVSSGASAAAAGVAQPP